DLVGDQAWNARHARRHDRQAGGHRFEQYAWNPLARTGRQHEQVVVAVHRHQPIERNRAGAPHAIADALLARRGLDRRPLRGPRTADVGPDDIERDVPVRRDEPGHRIRQHTELLAWIDAADGQDPDRPALTRV